MAMNKELKAQFDSLDFVVNPQPFLQETILGDDTDTTVGCCALKFYTGLEVGAYYDFDNLYYKEGFNTQKDLIGVDMSLIQKGSKCWDNHIALSNSKDVLASEVANINVFKGINAGSKADYHKKYAGSTALQIFAYYDGVKPKTEEAIMLWLGIDSGYKGHYYDNFKTVHNAYLEELGLGYMIDTLNKYTQKDFNVFANEYGLNSKNKLDKNQRLYNVGKWMKNNDGSWLQGKKLNMEFLTHHLGFEVSLPADVFLVEEKFNRQTKKVYGTPNLDKGNIFSMAYTYQNQIEYTSFR